MSTEAGADRQLLKQREFMQVLPLTQAIAGLPTAALGAYFNEGQMEARATALKSAFKFAKQLLLDVSK